MQGRGRCQGGRDVCDVMHLVKHELGLGEDCKLVEEPMLVASRQAWRVAAEMFGCENDAALVRAVEQIKAGCWGERGD